MKKLKVKKESVDNFFSRIYVRIDGKTLLYNSKEHLEEYQSKIKPELLTQKAVDRYVEWLKK